jgi:hypothetical protein
MLTIKEALDNPGEHTMVGALALHPVTGDLVFTASRWLQQRAVDPRFRAQLVDTFAKALMGFAQHGKLDA